MAIDAVPPFGVSGNMGDFSGWAQAVQSAGGVSGMTGALGATGASGMTGATGARLVTGTAGAATGGLVNNAQLLGAGSQFVFAAATVANVLTDNLTATQINLLANFLSVVTTCVYAILTVENPTDILEA